MTQVLVVAAHPDDEVLGCGGTVARHTMAGDRVASLIVAEGATSRHANASSGRDEVFALKRAAAAAAEALGAEPPRFGGFPDNRLDTVALIDIVQAIEVVVAEVRPDCVYTHHAGDLNIDHRVVSNAVITACRPLPDTVHDQIYCFETPSSTEWAPSETAAQFRPNHFVGIDATLERKMHALAAYAIEMRDFPHPRSYQAVEALARWRGASVGLDAAEAFMLMRRVIR
jgi:N-acetylglucosamine malate deacetylase 1